MSDTWDSLLHLSHLIFARSWAEEPHCRGIAGGSSRSANILAILCRVSSGRQSAYLGSMSFVTETAERLMSFPGAAHEDSTSAATIIQRRYMVGDVPVEGRGGPCLRRLGQRSIPSA